MSKINENIKIQWLCVHAHWFLFAWQPRQVNLLHIFIMFGQHFPSPSTNRASLGLLFWEPVVAFNYYMHASLFILSHFPFTHEPHQKISLISLSSPAISMPLSNDNKNRYASFLNINVLLLDRSILEIARISSELRQVTLHIWSPAGFF